MTVSTSTSTPTTANGLALISQPALEEREPSGAASGFTPEFVRWLDSRDEPSVLRELTAESIEVIAPWLSMPANYKWLDFGNGRQILNAAALNIMRKSGAHCLRSVHAGDRIEGITGLQNVDNVFKSAMLWGVRMRQRPPRRTNAVQQTRDILAIGFNELKLTSIYCWVVAINGPSIRTVTASGMRNVGRQRLAHVIDGVAHDRLLFDVLASEFAEQEETIRAIRLRGYT